MVLIDRVNDQELSRGACERCGQHFEFPTASAGAVVDCPACGQSTSLLPSQASSSDDTLTELEIESWFGSAIAVRPIPAAYTCALLLVAGIMLLLPVAYLCLVATAAYGVFWYAIHGLGLVSGGSLGTVFIRSILYVAPIIGGLMVVFFMLKPFLAKRATRPDPIHLDPLKHPLLYQFAEHICRLLGVPMPAKIYLDSRVTASGGLLRLTGRKRAIMLGLPLLTSMDTQQLAFVLAHELGHCGQGTALRLQGVVKGINDWFERIVYERDTWDESFAAWAKSFEGSQLWLVAGCGQLAVWLSRQILKFFMFLGRATSCLLSRRMEYHADSCGIAVAGSEALESSLIRLREQELIQSLAVDALGKMWNVRRELPDDFPEFLRLLGERLPPEFNEGSFGTLTNERSTLFATHPTAAQRIRRARLHPCSGAFRLNKPARGLLNRFEIISAEVTKHLYQRHLRLRLAPQQLKPAAEFFESTAVGQQRFVVPHRH